MDRDRGKQIVTVERDNNSPASDDDAINWDTDDELELEFAEATTCDRAMAYGRDSPVYLLEAASSSSSSTSIPVNVGYFISMGFDEKIVRRAINENGEKNYDAILNSLLTYSELENSPEEAYPRAHSPIYANLEHLSDGDSTSGDDWGSERLSTKKDRIIAILFDMDYRLEDILSAIEMCGPDAPLEELVDFICASEIDAGIDRTCEVSKKRKLVDGHQIHRHRPPHQLKRVLGIDSVHLPNPMIGFGAPGFTSTTCYRHIPPEASGPPFFYYENVALTPKGVWQKISEALYGIEPEFVDSIHFSAAARKRGYIHNLPLDNRHPLLPIPPMTIHEALPDTKAWWPSWDKRTKLNCLLTCIGSAQLTERIRKRVESGTPSEADKDYAIKQCKKWNLVWVGKSKVAVLEPEEMEYMLGFPKYHTRGINRTDRYTALGNSFQIDTVAYHLSVLKPIYPGGINVLSLFSGIGGAEVALDRLGIPLKNVVSVEISQASRRVFQSWWEQTGQTGRLIHLDDVEKVSSEMIERWVKELGGFDLVIGGSPCNNLAGGNRRTRDGLEGEKSSLFFQYLRILRCVMARRRGSR